MYTHCPEDPNCEECRMTQTVRARCENRPLKRAGGISLGDLITADHKTLTLDDGSRNGHGNALIVQDGYSYWLQSCILRRHNMRQKQHLFQRDPCLHDQSQQESGQTIQGSFIKACQDRQWTQDTNPPHRSKTNGIAERAIR